METTCKLGKVDVGTVENEKTSSPDYEAMYYKQLEEREVLLAKLDFLRSEKESLETEVVRLRAQMDIVYLIFGGK